MTSREGRDTGISRRAFLKVTGAIVIVAGVGGCGSPATEQRPAPTPTPVDAPTGAPLPTNTPETAQILTPASEIPAADGYLLVDIKKCQGCASCMLACSLIHEGVESLSLSRIQIMQDSVAFFTRGIATSPLSEPLIHEFDFVP